MGGSNQFCGYRGRGRNVRSSATALGQALVFACTDLVVVTLRKALKLAGSVATSVLRGGGHNGSARVLDLHRPGDVQGLRLAIDVDGDGRHGVGHANGGMEGQERPSSEAD